MKRMCAATLLALLLLAWVAPVEALPPGGASGDTAGTAGSVSPSTLSAGEVLKFSVSGFPAGETINVKIDDGEFCSDKSVHGACVVHQQRIGASGKVSGSFALPADIGAGDHWLRFLASEELVDAEGRYVGVKPYSLRGNANFTVVATGGGTQAPTKAGDAASNGSGGSDESSGSGAGTGKATGADGEAVEGVAAGSAPKDAAHSTLRIPAPPASAGTQRPEVSSEPGVEAADAQANLNAASSSSQSRFPYVGAGVLLLAFIGAGLLALRGRTGRTRSRA